MISKRAVAAVLLLLLVGGLAMAACGGGTTTSSSSTTTTQVSGETTTSASASTTSTTAPGATTTSSPETITISAYFVRGEKIAAAHRTIPRTVAVGEAAIRALIDGPNAEEKAAGLTSAVPAETEFRGLAIQNGLATLDLSESFAAGGGTLSMQLRLAQVVYTLTQFPTVERVSLELDGQPVQVFGSEGIIISHPLTRADFEDQTPAVFVESPAVGDSIESPVRIFGTANVFEAALTVEILSSAGQVLAEQPVQATSGTGTRGTFDVTVPFTLAETGPGTVVAFSISAKDGSRINEVRIPVLLQR